MSHLKNKFYVPLQQPWPKSPFAPSSLGVLGAPNLRDGPRDPATVVITNIRTDQTETLGNEFLQCAAGQLPRQIPSKRMR